MASKSSSSVSSNSRRISSAPSKHPIVDTRPIRDRTFMEQTQQTIIDYLQSKKYPHLLGSKSLLSPTKKDFELIFKFLFARIDPFYTYGKKFEDDVAFILRHVIKYPFSDNISKSSLQAVGSVQSWPHILAMLLSLVELLKAADRIEEKCEAESSSENWDSHSAFSLRLRAYALKKMGYSDEEVERDIRKLFAEKNKTLERECQTLTANVQRLETQLTQLLSKPSPLEAEHHQKDVLLNERKQLELDQDEQLRLKHELYTLMEDNERYLKELDLNLMELNEQKKDLELKLSTQEIQREEAEKLAKERENLMSEISQNEAKCTELAIQYWESDRILKEEASKVNALITEFNKLSSDLSLPMELSLNLFASDLKDMVNHEQVRPLLLQLRNEWNEELNQLERTEKELTDELNAVTEAGVEADLKLIQLDRDVKLLAEEYQERKLYSEETFLQLTSQLTRLDQEVKLTKDSTKADLAFWENKVQEAKLDYDRTLRECTQAKDYVLTNMRKMVEEITEFKNHVEYFVQALASEVDAVQLEGQESSIESTLLIGQ